MLKGILKKEKDGILYVGKHTTMKVLITFNDKRTIQKDKQKRIINKIAECVDAFDKENADTSTATDELIDLLMTE